MDSQSEVIAAFAPRFMYVKDKMLITGGRPLMGEITVSGGKNTAVAAIAATLLCDEPCTVENLPDIDDVHALNEILQSLGAQVDYVPGKYLTVDPRGVHAFRVPYALTKRLRASYYMLGALLGRGLRAEVAYPGGCDIGSRLIDQHLKGFAALGARIDDRGGMVYANAERLTGGDVFFDLVTVGGTINVMLAAVRAEGTTVMYNVAKEPHIVDLANFLNSMGARIKGAGTDVIRVMGGRPLHGSNYAVIPDQIETGTLMIAAAATGGDVVITGAIPTHMEALSAKLLEMGVYVGEDDDRIHIRSDGNLRAVNIKTQVYPGFPTDLQQPMAALLCTANGSSTITETIFENRFRYLEELKRMGADIRVFGRTAVVDGIDRLIAAPVTATDLRAGASMIVAGLMAEGITDIYGVNYILRGYDGIDRKLRSLGAKVEMVLRG